MSAALAGLVKAVDRADADRRAVTLVPEVMRQPGAADEAYAQWEAAHEALAAARREAEMEAGG